MGTQDLTDTDRLEDLTPRGDFRPNAKRLGKFRRFPTLRIKAASLAAEGRIIRREAAKALALARQKDGPEADKLRETRDSLRQHNRDVVSVAARETHLALAYLRGTPYAKVERPYGWVSQTLRKGAFDAAKRHAWRETEGETLKDFNAWVEDGVPRPGIRKLVEERIARHQV